VDILNIALMVATIAFGLIGWLAPHYTIRVLDLRTEGSEIGLSEVRAASGALFVAMALAAIVIGAPLAYAMVGFAYAGAAVGRITSIILDRAGGKIPWSFLAVEASFAAWLIGANFFFA